MGHDLNEEKKKHDVNKKKEKEQQWNLHQKAGVFQNKVKED